MINPVFFWAVWSVSSYKNLSWVWRWDRKICAEDHQLASQGLPSDYKRWSRGTDFSIPSPHKLRILFLAHHLIPQFIFEKHVKKNPENHENAEMWHSDVIITLQWRHRSTCSQRVAGVQLFIFYLSHGLVHVCEINRIHHWSSVGTEKSQPEGPPFQWKTRLAEFPTERWTRGLGFFWNHWTPMIDSFSHIPRPYGTALCNICWWRHWGRC